MPPVFGTALVPSKEICRTGIESAVVVTTGADNCQIASQRHGDAKMVIGPDDFGWANRFHESPIVRSTMITSIEVSCVRPMGADESQVAQQRNGPAEAVVR